MILHDNAFADGSLSLAELRRIQPEGSPKNQTIGGQVANTMCVSWLQAVDYLPKVSAYMQAHMCPTPVIYSALRYPDSASLEPGHSRWLACQGMVAWMIEPFLAGHEVRTRN